MSDPRIACPHCEARAVVVVAAASPAKALGELGQVATSRLKCNACGRDIDPGSWCPFVYGDRFCGSETDPQECNKTRFDCERHGNLVRFGAVPYLPKAPTPEELRARLGGAS